MKIRTSTYSFADYSASRRKIRSRFFNQTNRLIDWEAVHRIFDTARLKPKRKKDGRPSYDSLVLFRIELLRVWYGLSDGEIEDQVNDRLSFSRFAGIGLEYDVPDSTTICRFRNSLCPPSKRRAVGLNSQKFFCRGLDEGRRRGAADCLNETRRQRCAVRCH